MDFPANFIGRYLVSRLKAQTQSGSVIGPLAFMVGVTAR
jgi:hypothetical protein